jgi:Flp pilus assembly protein TadG
MPAMTEGPGIQSSKCLAKLRALLKSQAGAVAVYVGLTIPLFVGAGGLAVDVTGWYRAKRNIQSAADAAAYAAALNLAQQGLLQTPDQTALQAAANDAAARNGVSAPVQLNPLDSRTIEVVATEPAPLFFTSAFLDSTPSITARAVARAVVSDACIWALHPSAKAAFEIAGSAQVNLDCGVVVNSTDPEAALEQTGSSCLSATSVSVRGDYAGNCVTPPPEVHTPDYGDPLSHLQPPAYGSCDFPNKVTVDSAYTNQQGGGPVSLPNGVYCGGLEIKANQTVIFQPGLYVLKGGQFYIAGNAHVSNAEDSSGGVTFYLTGSGSNYATLRFESGADIALTPMTVPPLEHVLFYQDPNAPANGSNKIAGGVSMDLTGILYFPNQHIEFTGGSSTSGAQVLIVSSTITFTGNTYLNADYASGLLPEQHYVRLVE